MINIHSPIFNFLGLNSYWYNTWVVVVSTVSRPMETRAGDASTLIQNETHDRMTISVDGT